MDFPHELHIYETIYRQDDSKSRTVENGEIIELWIPPTGAFVQPLRQTKTVEIARETYQINCVVYFPRKPKFGLNVPTAGQNAKFAHWRDAAGDWRWLEHIAGPRDATVGLGVAWRVDCLIVEDDRDLLLD